MAAWIIPLIASGVMKAYGSQLEAEDKASSLEDDAQTAEQNAQLARDAGRYNAERIRINGEKSIGSIEADYAASGVSADSTSALEVLRESHTNAELDRQNTLFAADVRYNDLKRRAANARTGAANAREAGRISAFTSLFEAGAEAAEKYGDKKNNSAEFRKGKLKADSEE